MQRFINLIQARIFRFHYRIFSVFALGWFIMSFFFGAEITVKSLFFLWLLGSLIGSSKIWGLSIIRRTLTSYGILLLSLVILLLVDERSSMLYPYFYCMLFIETIPLLLYSSKPVSLIYAIICIVAFYGRMVYFESVDQAPLSMIEYSTISVSFWSYILYVTVTVVFTKNSWEKAIKKKNELELKNASTSTEINTTQDQIVEYQVRINRVNQLLNSKMRLEELNAISTAVVLDKEMIAHLREQLLRIDRQIREVENELS